MNKTARQIRIGKINFTNVWPIFHNFDVVGLGEQIEMISQVPTELNEGMALGNIDMGPISSFAYAENYEQYFLFPDLSVSSYGRVNSILLFHRKPLKEIKFGNIALPTTSATSVNLLKIIMTKFLSEKPTYFFAPPSLDDMMVEADAALLIGDDAIKANWHNQDYEVTDLGELWRSFTGHWMSFAVWAIRKNTAKQYPELVEKVFLAFQQSKQISLRDPSSMITEAQTKLGGDKNYWYDYFSQLCYDFGALQREGLELYYKYALELKLIQKEVPLQIWSNKTVV
jgi:chorismate dehydratase